MLLSRKIGAFLRGRASPPQVFLAALLAGLLGFVPGFFLPGNLGGGFAQAPGLILALLFLVLVLNANLGVFALVTLLAKLLSLALLPWSFSIGRALLDGPLQPLFRTLVNAPVFAWFGLDYYATTGGLVLGLVFGTLTGWLLVRALALFRRQMAGLEAGSERYQKWSQRSWVRLLTWLFFGAGKGKKVTWQELADSQRKGLPVRVFGVVLVAGMGVLLWLGAGLFASPALTSNLQQTLTVLNGATVDLERVELSLTGGRLSIEGLAIADSSRLDTDLFRASHLEAVIDTGAILRRRFVIDQLRAADASAGLPRQRPGTKLERPAPAPPPPAEPDAKTIDDYLKDVELWRARLEQAREWIEVIAGSEEPAPETPEQRDQRVSTERQQIGAAMVVAKDLRDREPAVVIRRIDIEGIACGFLPGETLDLRARSLSTTPARLAEAPELSLATRSDRLSLALQGPRQGHRGVGLDLALRQLPVDDVFGQFRLAGKAPVRGGTIDLVTKGGLHVPRGGEAMLDLPLQATLVGTTFALPGAKETQVERLLLPIGVRGALLRPTVQLDDQTLTKALLDAGKQELAGFVQQQAGKLLGGVPGAAQLLEPGKTPEQILDSAKQQAEAEARRQADEAKQKAEEAAKKAAGDALRGILPGGRRQ